MSESFVHNPLPGRPARDERHSGRAELRGVPQGILATFQVATTGAYTDLRRSFTDACIRTTFTPYDTGGRLGLSARHALIGGAQIYYALNLALPKGLVWLSRNVQFPDHASSEMIGRTVTLPRQPLPGAPITLELRVQGPSLRAWIEGEPVLAEHDPTFTCGGFGIRCGREQEAAQEVNVLCHGYEIRGVAA